MDSCTTCRWLEVCHILKAEFISHRAPPRSRLPASWRPWGARALFLSVATFGRDGIFIWRPEGGMCLNRMWAGPGDSLLLPAPGPTTTINLHQFLFLHAAVMSHCCLGCSEMMSPVPPSPKPAHRRGQSLSSWVVDVLSATGGGVVSHRHVEEQPTSNQLLHPTLFSPWL